MFFSGKGKKRAGMSVLIAVMAACLATGCGPMGTGSAGGGAGTGTGSASGTGSAGTGTGTGSSGSMQRAVPEDSILYFRSDPGFARLKSDMDSGDIPVECSVLYDQMGERPDVTVKDAASIREIYDLLAQVKVGEKSTASITDGYHHVSFHLRNDSYVSFYFEGESLFCWGYDNYDVYGSSSLWSYVRQLQDVAMEKERQKAAAASAGSTGGGTAGTAVAKADETAAGTAAAGGAAKDALDGKNPTADDGKDAGAGDSGENALTGKVPRESLEDREVAAQHVVGELTQQEPEIAGSAQEQGAQEEVLPDQTGLADASLQAELPAGSQAAQDAGGSAAEGQAAQDGMQAAGGENAGQQAAEPGAGPAAAENAPAQESGQSVQDGEQAGDTQAARTAAMESAYTELVRAYAAVLSQDGAKFLEDYENGVYDVAVTDIGTAGADAADQNFAEDAAEGYAQNAAEAAQGQLPDAAGGTSAPNEMQDGAETESGISGEPFGEEAADPAGTGAAQGLTPALDPRLNYEMFREYFANPVGNDVWYGLRDYDGDGTPELAVALGTQEFRHIWAAYTFNGIEAVPLFTGENALGYRIDLFTLPDSTFLIHGSGGASAGADTIARIAAGGTGLEVIARYEYDEQANGTMDHISPAGTLTDEEFQARYWSQTKAATEDISFSPARADALIRTGADPTQQSGGAAQQGAEAAQP